VRSKDTKAIKLFEQVICDEVNVKRIEIVESDDKFNIPYLTVNFKKAGALLKNAVQDVKEILANLDDEEMQNAVKDFEKDGKVTLMKQIGSQHQCFVDLPADIFTLAYKGKTEFVSITAGDLTVVLDTVLTVELIEECLLRELIRAIQVARQTANLEITARVVLNIATDSAALINLVKSQNKKITEEVLATEIVLNENKPKKGIEVEGHNVEITFN